MKTDEILKSTESMRSGLQTMTVNLTVEERVSLFPNFIFPQAAPSSSTCTDILGLGYHDPRVVVGCSDFYVRLFVKHYRGSVFAANRTSTKPLSG